MRRAHVLRSRRAVVAASAALLALVGGPVVATLGGVAPASAAPGTPGTPSAPVVVYSEDFENVPAAVKAANGAYMLDNPAINPPYVGASGTTYTADPIWLNGPACNGILVDSLTDDTGANTVGCGGNILPSAGYNMLLAAIGDVNGSADPTTNYGLLDESSAVSTGQYVMLQTVNGVTASEPLANRFVTFQLNLAAVNCGAADPAITIALVNNGQEFSTGNSGINPCTDPRTSVSTRTWGANHPQILVGTFAESGSTLVGTQGTLGFVARDTQPASSGNDLAWDDLKMLDVTPQLDMAFAPGSTTTGGAKTLTFTVTNTSELASKDGWGFTDALPAGLVVAPTPNLGGTCTATTTAAAGASSIAVTAGALAQNETSCTITVDVTSATAATYTDVPGSVTLVGLNAPAATTTAFVAPVVVTPTPTPTTSPAAVVTTDPTPAATAAPSELAATGTDAEAALFAGAALLAAGLGLAVLRRRRAAH